MQKHRGFMFDRETAEEIARNSSADLMAALATALLVGIGLLIAAIALSHPASARGFDWFFAHVHPTGQCSFGQEVAASFYWSGRHTASGEHFDPSGNTAASRRLPLGTVVTVTNPHNGRSIKVRINDRGPYGIAHRLGVKLDLARGAARRLGMTQTGWVCVSSTQEASE